VLVVCTLEFEVDSRYDWIVVPFEDLRYSAPFVEVQLDKSDGVLVSYVSFREGKAIVRENAQRLCAGRRLYAMVGFLFCITHKIQYFNPGCTA